MKVFGCSLLFVVLFGFVLLVFVVFVLYLVV